MVIIIPFTTLMTTLPSQETNYSRLTINPLSVKGKSPITSYILDKKISYSVLNKDGVPALVKSLLLNKVQAVFPHWNCSLGLHNLYMSPELFKQTRWSIKAMEQRMKRIMDTNDLF